MIALNNKIIKSFLKNLFQKIDDKINIVKKDINKLNNFSELLEIVSINKIDEPAETDSNLDILYILGTYETIWNTNDYSFCKCPQCNNDHCMDYHKLYRRNITFHLMGYEINAIISIIVLECSFCKEYNKGKQHYHAVLPECIFPYHTFSSTIIINALTSRFIKKMKIEMIVQKYRISHQLFYKWLKGLKKYMVTSSIILATELNIEEILNKLNNDIDQFLYLFYKEYRHPYFLFKLTCVPLAIMP